MGSVKAPDSVGGFYQSYASGDGGIRFVHADIRGNADGEPVPYWAAAELKPEGFALRTFTGGELVAFQPVQRVAPNVLEIDGEQYQYAVVFQGNGWKRYNFFFYDETPRKWQELVNVSKRAALAFFLNNEKECAG